MESRAGLKGVKTESRQKSRWLFMHCATASFFLPNFVHAKNTFILKQAFGRYQTIFAETKIHDRDQYKCQEVQINTGKILRLDSRMEMSHQKDKMWQKKYIIGRGIPCPILFLASCSLLAPLLYLLLKSILIGGGLIKALGYWSDIWSFEPWCWNGCHCWALGQGF